MKLSDSKDTVKCPYDRGNGRCRGRNKGSRKNWLMKLLCLMMSAVLTGTALTADLGMRTVNAEDVAVIVGPSAIANNDLGEYITGMTLQRKNAAGEWEKFPEGGDIVVGNNYKLNVHFEGGAKKFTSPMTWNLGDNVQCAPVENEPIWDGNTKIGTYTLTEDGRVTVNFTEEFLERANQKLDMSFEMVPTSKGDGGEHVYPWSGRIEVHDVVDNTAKLEVQKTAGYYNSSSGSITYTVEASVTAGMVTEGKLEDVMGEGLSFRNVENMKVYDADGRDVTERYQSYIDSLMKQAESQEKKDGDAEGKKKWTLSPLPPLTEGMRFVVEYKGEVAEDKRTDRKYVANNTVTFSGTKPDNQPADQKTATADKNLAKDQITKKGNTTVITENGVEKEVIQWQVRIGSGQWDPLEGDLTIEDTLGKGLSFRKGEDFIVQWCDKDGNIKGTAQIPWTKIQDSEANGKAVATYYLKKDLFRGYKWDDGDYLMVTYNTDFDLDKQPQNGFENTVKNDVLAPEGTTGRLPVGEAVQKTVVDHEEESYLAYTVVVDVPPCSHMKSMKGHSDDGHEELDLPYFYIEDRLDFGDDYFALNIPNDITVKAESKDLLNQWTFENVPYTSGNGNPDDKRETFQILQDSESTYSGSEAGKIRRAFRIYFNTARYGLGSEGKLERHDSIWDINEATQLIITYNIPYSTNIVDKYGNDTGKTLGQLLNEGLQLENKAISRRSGVDLEKSCYSQKNPEVGGIDKLARILEDGVVEYYVTFINDDGVLDEKGKTSRLIKPDAFKTSPPVFTDTFDERMEYVEGSLHVEVRNMEDGKLYDSFWYKGDSPVSGNTIRASMEMFTEKVEGDDTREGDIKKTFESHRRYVFVYQLQLKEEYRKDWEPDENIKNHATFQYGNTTVDADTTVDIPSDMLQKSFRATENGTLEYTLNVNSTGANLVTLQTGEGTVDLDSYKLVDEMSENLRLVTEPDGDYKITVEYEAGKNDDGSEKWELLERSSQATGINPDSHNYFRGSEEGNGIFFILPDELHIRITYEVIVDGPENSKVLASNKATLYADKTETDEKNTIVEVGKSSASGSGDPVVRLEKKDAEDETKLLGGAQFALYSDRIVPNGKFITVMIDGKEKQLYEVKTYTTNDFGEITQITPEGIQSEYGEGLYALIETVAPEGYILDETPQFFRFSGSKVPAGEDKVEYNGKEYEVLHAEMYHTFKAENQKKEYLRLVKTDKDGSKNLKGAVFSLFSCTKDASGAWVKEDSPLYTGTSDEEGVVQWGDVSPNADRLDLKDGNYYLEEKEAPSGYRSLEGPIIITVEKGRITASTMDGKPLTSITPITPIEEGSKVTGFIMEYKIKNEKQPALRLIKEDMSDSPLPGAEFSLYAAKDGDDSKMGDCLWTGKSDGAEGYVYWTAYDEEASAGEKDLTLSPGTYYLVETKAPEGYNELEDKITITVKEDGSINFAGDKKYFKFSGRDDGVPVIQYSILNPESYALPETGGSGNFVLYLWAGLVLALGCGIFLISRKRPREIH